MPDEVTMRTDGASDVRRRARRHSIETLSSDLGDVVDLSTTGMRVAGSGKPPQNPGAIGTIRLQAPEGTIAIKGRIAWAKRRWFRGYEMGIEFQEVDPKVATALDLLGRFGFIKGAPARDLGGAKPPRIGEHGSNGKARTKRVSASFDLPDYYAILGLGINASDEKIRDAFRAIARQCHPDVATNETDKTRFLEAKQAYETLRDPVLRKNYDIRRAA